MTPDIRELRALATKLFAAAVKAADPGLALAKQFALTPIPRLDGGRHFVIAVGKAACAMAEGTLQHLPTGAIAQALAVTNYENARDVAGCTVMAAGHPVPDANGERASAAVIALLEQAGPGDLVIGLISGGGSALLPAPIEGVTLADKAEVSRVLLGAGFDITELNTVRQHLSRLKGGGMARLAAPAKLHAYILSDVLGDDLRVVGSGPTVSPIASHQQARELLMARDLMNQMPASVQVHFAGEARELAQQPPDVVNTLICSNRQSLEATTLAARELGLQAHIVSDRLEGDVGAAAARFAAAIAAAPAGEAIALLAGGETTVKLTGKGQGGRNQEFALRMALKLTPPEHRPEAGQARSPSDWVFLSGGTDGRDGPTDAAGGIVDPGSVSRMIAAGADPDALLADNDSYAALTTSGDLLITGATGTNVADIQIFIQR